MVALCGHFEDQDVEVLGVYIVERKFTEKAM